LQGQQQMLLQQRQQCQQQQQCPLLLLLQQEGRRLKGTSMGLQAGRRAKEMQQQQQERETRVQQQEQQQGRGRPHLRPRYQVHFPWQSTAAAATAGMMLFLSVKCVEERMVFYYIDI
jgi:hypothetical protein